MKRVKWVDEYKGFLLLFVVLAHLEIPLALVTWVEMMYMPAFFLISGYLFRRKENQVFTAFFQRKWISLLKPYLLLSFVGFFFDFKWLFSIRSINDITDYITTFSMRTINGGSTPAVGTIWFVYTLFQLTIVYYFVDLYDSKLKVKHVLSLLVAVVCLVIGWECNQTGYEAPLNLDLFASSMLFYIIGHKVSQISVIHNKWVLLAFAILLGPLYLKCVNTDGYYVDYVGNTLGHHLWLYLAGIFSASFFLWAVTELISRYSPKDYLCLGHFLQYIANNGIAILAFHWVVFSNIRAFWQDWNMSNTNLLITLIVVAVGTSVLVSIVNRCWPELVGKTRSK